MNLSLKLPSFSAKKVKPGYLRKSASSTDTASLSSSFCSVGNGSDELAFSFFENKSALSWWDPIHVLAKGSISDIHLVKRRCKFKKVKLNKKHNLMDDKKMRQRWTKKEDCVKSDDLYVLKSIAKLCIGDEQVIEEMRSEIATLSKLSHPNICSVVEAYSTNHQVYLVMEFCSGGTLRERIPMIENEACEVTKKILEAVNYLHECGICHRDIKLENVVFTDKGELKLIDFGLATEFRDPEGRQLCLQDRVGTLYSMSPQVITGSYDQRCDLWSIGVVTYLLLSGLQPFSCSQMTLSYEEQRSEMMDRIENCEFSPMYGAAWHNISTSAKAFVQSLLQHNPDNRPAPKMALDSAWITTCRNY